MSKRKIFILIVLLLILYFLVTTWLEVIGEEFTPVVRHYLAFILFVPLVMSFFQDVRRCIIYTGIYLVLATFHLIAITPYIGTYSIITIAGSLRFPFPSMSVWALLMLILYTILHFDTLSHYYLDYKETKQKWKSKK